ncbi:universal stress protein [Yoonia sp.]|uniref:universal stress protein n=1 Tax=Yoonia sp. TaxID=2212373 RepID=UPI003976CB4A
MMTSPPQELETDSDMSARIQDAEKKKSDVVVFVEDAITNGSGIGHSQRVARAFGGKVVLVNVQCRLDHDDGPIDPVEWDIRKQQTLKWLNGLTRSVGDDGPPCEVKLLEGDCVNEIRNFMEHRQSDIAGALRRHGDNGWSLSKTASGVLSSRSAGVLMIPQDASVEHGTTYKRILVPLDGSTRAEIALPRAVVMALAEDAELLLFYVSPNPGVTEFGVKDQDAERLHAQVRSRNRKAGKSYLAGIRNRLNREGLTISTKVCDDGDARRALTDAISRENVDFVVMATHGQSGHRDVPTGDVARYIMNRAATPVLLIRHLNGSHSNHVFGKLSSEGVRQPVGTD